MKRLLVLILAFSMLFATASADYDRQHMKEELMSMTDEELLDFYIEYQMITAGRGLFCQNGTWLYPGIYEIGIDIPAGNYCFDGVEAGQPASVFVYPSLDNMAMKDIMQDALGIGKDALAQIPKTGKFILKDGNILEVKYGIVSINQWKGLLP